MIKRGRLPFRGIVAVGALGHLIRKELRELPSVDVLMTVLALLRRLLKIDIDQLGFEVRWFVAVNTSHRPVRPCQWK